MHVPDDLPSDLARALAAGPLVRVVTGSHLHGFSHAGSDHDAWVVVPEPRDLSESRKTKKIFQSIERHEDRPVTDITVVGLSTWLRYCQQGIPQALDVMFATGPAVEVDVLATLRGAYRANPTTATPSFRRMMRQIVEHRVEDAKQRRHAFRLALNLRHIQETGRYAPSLTTAQRQWVLDQASDPTGFVDRLVAYTGMTFE